MTRALVAGGTGAVGRALLPLLASSDWEVHAWGRRRTDIAGVSDIAGDLGKVRFPAVDVAFCSLGTTHKEAGSEAAFRAVDHDLVLDFARAARAAGARCFTFVSSAGASRRAPSHYLKLKAEVEKELATLGFDRLVLVRPSLLLDDRPGRPWEQLAVEASRLLAPALRWFPARGIEVKTLALAMIRLAEQEAPGVVIVENRELHRLGASS